jgi:hypothetical protein
MDWSLLKGPDVLKFGAAALGIGVGVFAVIDKILSRNKPSTAPTIIQNIYIGGWLLPLQLDLFKKP